MNLGSFTSNVICFVALIFNLGLFILVLLSAHEKPYVILLFCYILFYVYGLHLRFIQMAQGRSIQNKGPSKCFQGIVLLKYYRMASFSFPLLFLATPSISFHIYLILVQEHPYLSLALVTFFFAHCTVMVMRLMLLLVRKLYPAPALPFNLPLKKKKKSYHCLAFKTSFTQPLCTNFYLY